jgi:hypothetical protein
MELKDFVSETLKQIIEGVRAAQEAAMQTGAQINPTGLTPAKAGSEMYSPRGQVAQLISFDVSVTTTETDKAKGGVGIFVGGVGVAVQGASGFQNTAANRIQFAVPVVLPQQR